MNETISILRLKDLLREFKDLVLEGEFNERLLRDTVRDIYSFLNDQPMTRKEAAAYLGVSLTTFDKYRQEGRFPEHYPGGRQKKWARARFFRSEITINLTQSLPGFRGIDGGNP